MRNNMSETLQSKIDNNYNFIEDACEMLSGELFNVAYQTYKQLNSSEEMSTDDYHVIKKAILKRLKHKETKNSVNKLIPSALHGEVITAFNLRTREKEKPMLVTKIFKYESTNTHNPRYQMKGIDIETNDVLYKFCSEKSALLLSEELSIVIITKHADP